MAQAIRMTVEVRFEGSAPVIYTVESFGSASETKRTALFSAREKFPEATEIEVRPGVR